MCKCVHEFLDAHVINEIKKLMALPRAVSNFSISPFISRSIALATSTLLYLEYLSNTEGGDRLLGGTSDRNNHILVNEESNAANLDGDEGRFCW